ncbi:MAG: glycosyltransferase family 39 protein [Chitinophagaceae bacterium]|nr:glycosyltransferase family 39 protein [Chitinophagaceae bacterium]
MLKALSFKSNVSANIKVIFWCILVAYAITELSFCSTEDLTADETAHLTYGAKIVKGMSYKRSCTLDDSKMPVSALNALPRAVEQALNPGLKKSDGGDSDTRLGRYITFLFSLVSLYMVFKWSSEWYGEKAGLFSMGLTAFCPTFLAHSGLVTTDAYSVLVVLLVLYTFWKYLNTHSGKYFILFCICTGIAQITKQTFFYLYILIPLFLVIYYPLTKSPFQVKKALGNILIFTGINTFIINAGFLFYQTGQPLQEYVFVSKMFSNIQQELSFLGNIPIPLPSPFLLGMDSVKYVDETGGGYPEGSFPVVSILGFREQGKSYWFYYIVTIFFKTPIPTLLFFLPVFFYVFQKSNRSFFIKNELILVIPIVFFLIIMSFFNNIQTGVRHILFLYPLLYILCGKIFLHLQSRISKAAIACCCAWLIVSVAGYANNYIPYTNEFITDKKLAYKKVGTTNLDFGQGYSFAQKYIQLHPDVRFAGTEPAKGKFIIAVGLYEDIFGRQTYNWIRKYPPYGHVRHSYLLIEVK